MIVYETGTMTGSNIFKWIASKQHILIKLVWGILTISPLKLEPCRFVLFSFGMLKDPMAVLPFEKCVCVREGGVY